MNWIKENKKLAGILGFMIFGAIGLGVVLFMSYSDYTAAVGEFETSNSRIKTLKSAKLFPSQENVALKEKSVTEYADKVNLLRGALLKVQQPVKAMSETEFQAKLKERSGTVKKLADAAGVSLPGGVEFALGFDEYTVSSPKSAEAAAELNVQLDMIENVVTTLIQSGVKSLDSLERTKLAVEKPTAAVPPPAPKAQVAPKNSKGKKPMITVAAAAEPVLDRYPVKMTMTTDQSPFQQVVNTLSNPSKIAQFLVLRLLRIENEKQEGPLKDEVRSRRNNEQAPGVEPGPGGNKDTAGATILAPKAAVHDAVTVMGEEKLKVYMEVDYIRFRPEATAEEDAKEPAATR
ncbi:hypothetical protein BH11VER1_BH11VER1_10560 [soil metagenome]